MARRLPILVTNSSDLARQIRSDLSSRSGWSFTHFTYDDCRRQIVWHKKGFLLLLAVDGQDTEPLASIVRECRLRRSALTVVIVQAGTSAEDAALAGLDQHVSGRIAWPGGADALADLIGNIRVEDREETLADMLSSRLRSLTPALAGLAGRLAAAASHDVTVLLSGETGTGKTHLARLLHEHSARRQHPFVMVPCGAQPAELFESALFGHVKGAFTGAHQSRAGKFAAAGKGTILLDEIETLSLEQQAALLRIIETGEYELVGSNQTLRSEARLIVASNCDLEEAVERGQFRQDLFYRLSVMEFHLPPLRERTGDIPLLARGFAARFAAQFRKPIVDIAPEVLQTLAAFPWPGNVRQLENAIQQAVLLCHGPELTLLDLPDVVRRQLGWRSGVPTTPASIAARPVPLHMVRNRAEYERDLIQKTLETCNHNRSSTARALGISRVTLYKKLKQYDLGHALTH